VGGSDVCFNFECVCEALLARSLRVSKVRRLIRTASVLPVLGLRLIRLAGMLPVFWCENHSKREYYECPS